MDAIKRTLDLLGLITHSKPTNSWYTSSFLLPTYFEKVKILFLIKDLHEIYVDDVHEFLQLRLGSLNK